MKDEALRLALDKKADNARDLGLNYDPENTLHWHALNYRTAPTQNAQEMFEALEKFVETAIKQALEQPEPEPVAWMTITPHGEEDDIWYENPEGKLLDDWTYKPLYTTPPKAQPEQKYRRGDRLVCLETDEYCVIHIAGTNRQWVKFPDTHIGVYTNEQLDQLFEKLTKEQDTEQPEPKCVAIVEVFGKDWRLEYMSLPVGKHKLYTQQYTHTSPPKREWQGLTDVDVSKILDEQNGFYTFEKCFNFAKAIEAKLKEKNHDSR